MGARVTVSFRSDSRNGLAVVRGRGKKQLADVAARLKPGSAWMLVIRMTNAVATKTTIAGTNWFNAKEREAEGQDFFVFAKSKARARGPVANLGRKKGR